MPGGLAAMIDRLLSWIPGYATAKTAIAAGLAGVLAAGVTFAACALYDRVVDDPSVRREATAGLVALSEKTALQAQIAEMNRRLAAAQRATKQFSDLLATSRAAEAAASAALEQDIARHEKALSDTGRSWRLDQSDIDWLRN